MSVYANQELAQFIRRSKTVAEYAKGDLICSQGDSFDAVFLLIKGHVKMYDIDADGNERTISVFKEGSVFPITWLLRDLPESYYYFYEAMTSVSCVVRDVGDVRDFVRTNPGVLLSLTDHLVRSYINLAGRVQNLERSRVSERLEFILFHLSVSLGEEIVNNISRIDAAITQEEIARLAGVTRESLSLEISQRQSSRPYWREGANTYIDLSRIDIEAMPTVLREDLVEQEAGVRYFTD